MFEIGAVDITAEARQRLVSLLHGWIQNDSSNAELVPQISIRSISPDEVKFQSGLDVCVVGPEFLVTDIARLGQLKKNVGAVPCICITDSRASSLTIVDQVARLGAEDIFRTDSSASEFLRRILFLVRRAANRRAGRLVVVDSAKGGSGTTTIAAGLAEALVDRGHKVCLVDADFESQDLSRFLLARPFINEPLELLLNGQRGISVETVGECIRPVWKVDDGLFIVTPPGESSRIGVSPQAMGKVFGNFVEALRARFDYVVFDSASTTTSIAKQIFAHATEIIYVASGDPAGFPAAGIRITSYSGLLAKDANVVLVLNGADYDGLSGQLGLKELRKLIPLEHRSFREHWLPSCRTSRQWPASGRTVFSLSKKINRALFSLAEIVADGYRTRETDEAVSRPHAKVTLHLLFWRPLISIFKRRQQESASGNIPQQLLPVRPMLEGQNGPLVSQPQFVE